MKYTIFRSNHGKDITDSYYLEVSRKKGEIRINNSHGHKVDSIGWISRDSELREFFLLVSLSDGAWNIYVYYSLNAVHIEFYLKLGYKSATYIPNNVMHGVALPSLIPKIAINEKVDEDYNAMFQLELYNYQLGNVKWMSLLEGLTDAGCNIIKYPKLRDNMLTRVIGANSEYLYNPYTRLLYPPGYEEIIPIRSIYLRGGILADDVGLGKTASMYALIVNSAGRQISFRSRKPSRSELEAERSRFRVVLSTEPGPKYKSAASLIICPARLVGQWKDELNKFMLPNGDLRVHTIATIVNYRKLTVAEVCNADIIIISNNFFINAGYSQHSEQPDNFKLSDFNWRRIIIDEGHEIMADVQDRSVIRIREKILKLSGQYKWLCTGTPFSHGYDNLNYYLLFLAKEYITDDWKSFDEKIVNKFLCQNTRKNTYENINSQIYIPPIVQTTVLLNQDPVERALYVSAIGDTTRMIQLCTNILVSDRDSRIINDELTNLDDIRKQMSNHYQSEMQVYQQHISCCEKEIKNCEQLHKDAGNIFQPGSEEFREYRSQQKTAIRVWKKRMQEHHSVLESMTSRKKLFDNFEQRVKADPCVICYENITDVVLTKCSHIFCKSCMQKVIENNVSNINCPLCRTKLNRKTDIGYLISKDCGDTLCPYYKNVQKWGTKMAWLVQYLNHILESADNRIIIYSQWKKMLLLVGKILGESKIQHVYLQGSVAQLNKHIQVFKTSDTVRVLMLSSETCNSGSNLTEASHIILLDTVNCSRQQAKSIEDQAIGRAARLGQTKNVQVIRLIMNDTIEYDYYKDNSEGANITEIVGGEDVFV